jgi:hypothetical protein
LATLFFGWLHHKILKTTLIGLEGVGDLSDWIDLGHLMQLATLNGIGGTNATCSK